MVVWTLKSQFSFQNSMFLNYNIYFFKTQLQIIHFLRFSLKSFFFFLQNHNTKRIHARLI
jgi:hypothetical protein